MLAARGSTKGALCLQRDSSCPNCWVGGGSEVLPLLFGFAFSVMGHMFWGLQFKSLNQSLREVVK